MKSSTLKPEFTGQFSSASTIQTPQLPGNYEQIRQRAQEIYRARGGMTLNDWLKAEQQLEQKYGKQTN